MGTHVREQGSCVREFEMFDTTALRPRVEAAIESLLALLDEIDGDADAEPALGAPEVRVWVPDSWMPLREEKRFADGTQGAWAAGGGEDGEEDAGEMAERDEAEDGIADADALWLRGQE